MVKVLLSSVFSDLTHGKREVEVEADTVEGVLNCLTEMFGDEFGEKILDSTGELKWFVTVYVNGNDIRLLNGTKTKVDPTDEVLLIHSVSGG